MGHRSPSHRHHPCSIGSLTSTYLEGREMLRAVCWTCRMVFTSEISHPRGSGGIPLVNNGVGGEVFS